MPTSSVPVAPPKRKKKKVTPGRARWAHKYKPRPAVQLALAAAFPLLLQRHVNALVRTGQLDLEDVNRTGEIALDMFGDAKRDGYRASGGHVLLLTFHFLQARAPQALAAWLPFGVCIMRTQGQASVAQMFHMGRTKLAVRLAALDGYRVMVDGVLRPIKLTIIGDGAYMRTLTRAAQRGRESPDRPTLERAAHARGGPADGSSPERSH